MAQQSTMTTTLNLEDLKSVEEDLVNFYDAIADLKAQTRADSSLANLHTGLNIPGKDKLSLSAISPEDNYLNPILRRKYRHSNFIVGNLVEVLPHAMCLKFFSYSSGDLELNQWMNQEIEEVCPYFKEALELSREQGGAGIIIYVDDGANSLSEPLNFNNIQSIDGYNVLSSEELIVNEWEFDQTSRCYGDVKTYKIVGSASVEDASIHSSRILKFHGRNIYKRLMIENQGWGYSVIDRAIKKIINLDQSSDAIATSLQTFNQTVLFIKDLAKKLATPQKKEQVKDHVRTIALLQSVLGIIALDAESERYEIQSRNYSNIDTILEHLVQMASGACDLPSTILLNRSATAGNNKGGISSNSGLQGRKEWAEYVSGRQKFEMAPQAREFIKIQELRKDNPKKGKKLLYPKLEYPSIFSVTETEQAQIDEQNSRTFTTYKNNNIVFEEEVRMAIAKNIPLSQSINLDKKIQNVPEDIQINSNQSSVTDPEKNIALSSNTDPL